MPYTENPATVPADHLRLLIGDVDPTSPELSDNEVSFFLALHAGQSMNYIAAAAAQVLLSAVSNKADKTVGRLSIKYSQRASQLKDLISQLEKTPKTSIGAPVLASSNGRKVLGFTDYVNEYEQSLVDGR